MWYRAKRGKISSILMDRKASVITGIACGVKKQYYTNKNIKGGS